MSYDAVEKSPLFIEYVCANPENYIDSIKIIINDGIKMERVYIVARMRFLIRMLGVEHAHNFISDLERLLLFYETLDEDKYGRVEYWEDLLEKSITRMSNRVKDKAKLDSFIIQARKMAQIKIDEELSLIHICRCRRRG